MATIGQALTAATSRLQGAGSPSPRLDAELLLGHVVGLDRAAVVAHPEVVLGADHAARFDAFVERRAGGEPVAYIREVKEFYGVALGIDARALIPRPETELLVELAIARTRSALGARPRPAGAPPFRILDLGTGSGAIAIAMARALRRARYGDAVRFTATDISEAALALAVENAVAQGVADMIDFRVADLLSSAVQVDGSPDLIAANLPYVASNVIDELGPAIAFEPRIALDGGPDGLDVIRRCLDELPTVLAVDGCALLEIGADQVADLSAAVAASLPGWTQAIHRDLAGRPRVLELGRASAAGGAGSVERPDPGRS
jgi:release factor glutamine methyltransferase